MAQTPGTCLHTYLFFHMAEGSNSRHTDECIVFTWRWLKHQAHTFSHESWQMAQTPGACMHTHILHTEISRWPKYQAHIFFIWRSADGPYTRHTHILHLEVASTKYNLSLSCSLSTVYYWVRIDNCRLHVDSIYWSFLEHAIIFTSMFPFLHTASSFITVFDWPQKWSKTILLCFSSIVMF